MFIEKFIKHVEKDTYFKNVHLFLKKIKNVARIKNAIQIRKNLFTYLRDLVLQWYISKLSKNIKNLLRFENEVEFWKKKLLKRFKKFASVTIISLIKKKYTMKNTRRKKKSKEYAEVILQAVKSADFTSEINQIFLIYNDIDVKFQKNISMSKANIKLNNFLTNLNDKKNV
jgi:hypothetical protein